MIREKKDFLSDGLSDLLLECELAHIIVIAIEGDGSFLFSSSTDMHSSTDKSCTCQGYFQDVIEKALEAK